MKEVLSTALVLLTECYEQLGSEPDTELDSEGNFLNPASVELFQDLEFYFKAVTGYVTDSSVRDWIIDPHSLNTISNISDSLYNVRVSNLIKQGE